MITNFVNLTNGIEAIPMIEEPFAFIRIQSTACEQKRWAHILNDLDYTFLLPISLGYSVTIYDFGARKAVPRAIYQGVEWIKYALNRRWLDEEYAPIVRGHNCARYFDECYRKLDDKTLKRLDYFRKFLNTDKIVINTVTNQTVHDGDYSFYASILAG
jgi:hypothetical protein